MALSKRIHNRNTLRVKLVRETIENCGSAYRNGFLERRADCIKIIQQMECDAIKTYKNVIAQLIKTSIIQMRGLQE